MQFEFKGHGAASLFVLGAAVAVLGCSAPADAAKSKSNASGSGGNTSGSGASGGASTGGVTSTGGSTTGGTSSGGSGGSVDVPVETALPELPKMSNVQASVLDDNVNITFAPVDGARDYRVYALPADSDISVDGSGFVSIQNAIYRCSGDRQAPRALVDGEADVQGLNIRTKVDGQDVHGYTRSLAEATLGYVYTEPGDGRVPVYAMGGSEPNADSDCDFLGNTTRWKESRIKTYTASESERTTLLSQNFRDDGIVFYVPATAAANTVSIYSQYSGGDYDPHYYFAEGAETAIRTGAEVAFQVLTDGSEAGTQPLMRAFYSNLCGKEHDELAVGNERFERARRQGDQLPVWDLHWAGITADTTLVVEALDSGCPYQGFLSTASQPSRDPYPEWLTFDQIKAASPSGEVYINGQHEAENKPKAIARSFIKVSPNPMTDLDWFLGFNSTDALGNLTDTTCGTDNCWQQFRKVSDSVDVSFMFVETDRYALAPMLGELWVTYGDVGADVNGKFRLTPSAKPELTDDTFLYSTMMVDTFTTGRRYPQIIISEADVPVQLNMENGHAIVIQTFGGWPNQYQVQVCDHQYWDVNAQCPAFDLFHRLDPNDSATRIGIVPSVDPGEHSGMDRGTLFEVYASSKRVYLMMDGQPYGCADLPAASVPAGPVTVTFGDVLYHSGVDYTFAYTAAALQISTRRHFDNLGFKAGLAAPTWDESRFPCATVIK